MTDWEKIYEADFVLPEDADLDELTDELAQCLRDPDPDVRDGTPYVVLRAWIARDVIDGERRLRLGDTLAARFADPEIEARAFAPLVLDMIVSRGDFRSSWLDAFTRWYPAETDLRGHHPRLGWLHAAAHGADLLAAFGRHPAVRPAAMLDLGAARLVAPTDHVFEQQEDDRIARALALTLTRPELTVAEAVGWLEPIETVFTGIRRVTTPAHATNAMRTLRALYLLADRGAAERRGGPRTPLTHGGVLKDRLADVLETVFQYS